ncbi:site-specific integrase [Paenibacillus sp. BR2-3]|uniref:tyrosine-type recombinase/integrase n=1 Tax=Paenibacillus sp. BR2-3 TaxID=3048494 RepID=UPI003977C313
MYQYIEEANEILKNYLETISDNKSKVFYQTRLNRFFHDYLSLDHNKARPMNALNFHDLNTFINSLKFTNNEKLNYFYAFKGFFSFAYIGNFIPNEIMKGVIKPLVKSKVRKYIDKASIEKLIGFTKDIKIPIEDRLLVGFFMYTGLSRQYIANLTNYQISTGNQYYSLHFDMGSHVRYVPLNIELTNLIKEYRKLMPIIRPYDKVFKLNENYISDKIKNLSKQITNHEFTPTQYSNTFIKYVLNKGNDVLSVSRLTLESLNTIEKHIDINEEEIVKKQINILEGLFEEDNIT